MRNALALFIAFGLLFPPLGLEGQEPLRGFPAALVPAQVDREQTLRAVPHPDTVRARLRLLSDRPHEAGSPGSLRVATLIRDRMWSFGLDARLERFEALMPRPVQRTLELVEPERWAASLEAPAFPEDEDTNDSDQLPSFNAYSADGDVTAELVYVNYGLPEDYAVLDSLGISVAGRIVIARYGRSWRGIKPKLATERGAIGTILYSDPEDDGYYLDDVYPVGPMRPWGGVQLGSIMDMPIHPGDPLSPGWASEEGSRRLPMAESETLVAIPVLPISYGDALPLLKKLGGPVAPEAWRGALPTTYHVGPGPAVVRLALEFEWETRPLYNVVARIPGSVYPDQWVVWGNHHDAWVHGAADPLSGMVTVEEGARALGALLATGWRPARTLILAGWDGEEWGLLGSTEWAEKHREELDEKGVVYFNTDSNNRGWLRVGGSHSLQTFMSEVARDIRDPQRGMSVLEAWFEKRREDGVTIPGRPIPAEQDIFFEISALGSGSDYTAFLDHVGLASVNVGYGGDSQAGVYHSPYDTFAHYSRFADTTFTFGMANAQTLATAIARMADAPVLPFEFGNSTRTYRRYANEIEQQASRQPGLAELDLSGVHAAVDRLESAAQRYERALGGLNQLDERAVNARRADLARANQLIYRTERMLTDPGGLPGREWFRHLIYAPGFFTGYGVKTMPGIREAVEDVPDLAVAQREATRVEAALNRYAEQVDRAAEALESLVR